ncbi:unnamed protein product [Sphagnum balticum]
MEKKNNVEKNVQLIAFDLRSIVKSHPEHSEIIKWAAEGSNPRFLWGMQTADTVLKQHGETIQGLFEFEGETAEQRDSREIAQMKQDLIEHLSFYKDGYNKELVRLIFAMKPAYYYAYYVEGKAARKIINRRKVVYDSGAAALDFDQLWQAKTKLEDFLHQSYGDSAFFTPRKSEPRKARFDVFVGEAGLSVKVTLTSKEGMSKEATNVNGIPLKEFIARVPETFASFAVKTNYWTLDRSFCDPE